MSPAGASESWQRARSKSRDPDSHRVGGGGQSKEQRSRRVRKADSWFELEPGVAAMTASTPARAGARGYDRVHANVSVDFAGLEARFFDIRGEALAEEERARVPSLISRTPSVSERERDKDEKIGDLIHFCEALMSIGDLIHFCEALMSVRAAHKSRIATLAEEVDRFRSLSAARERQRSDLLAQLRGMRTRNLELEETNEELLARLNTAIDAALLPDEFEELPADMSFSSADESDPQERDKGTAYTASRRSQGWTWTTHPSDKPLSAEKPRRVAFSPSHEAFSHTPPPANASAEKPLTKAAYSPSEQRLTGTAFSPSEKPLKKAAFLPSHRNASSLSPRSKQAHTPLGGAAFSPSRDQPLARAAFSPCHGENFLAAASSLSPQSNQGHDGWTWTTNPSPDESPTRAAFSPSKHASAEQPFTNLSAEKSLTGAAFSPSHRLSLSPQSKNRLGTRDDPHRAGLSLSPERSLFPQRSVSPQRSKQADKLLGGAAVSPSPEKPLTVAAFSPSQQEHVPGAASSPTNLSQDTPLGEAAFSLLKHADAETAKKAFNFSPPYRDDLPASSSLSPEESTDMVLDRRPAGASPPPRRDNLPARSSRSPEESKAPHQQENILASSRSPERLPEGSMEALFSKGAEEPGGWG
ncbi:hypothetical protein T484DRAFT_1774907, partial [Baffinella frigidus]